MVLQMNSYSSFLKYPMGSSFDWCMVDQQQKLIYQSLSAAQQNFQCRNVDVNWQAISFII